MSSPSPKQECRQSLPELDPALRLWSALTHGAGAVLAILGTAALLLHAAALGAWLLFGLFAIYGLSMICLYTASTLYHCVKTTPARRIALRKYDHCSIYLLIAGSYTPICVAVLGGSGGLWLLAAIWTLALAGIILSITTLSFPHWVSSVIYLLMGWMALFAIVPLYRLLPRAGFALLLTGGVLYTVGGVLYAVKWPGRSNRRFGCHEIFHLFILLGSVVHFILMDRVIIFL